MMIQDPRSDGIYLLGVVNWVDELFTCGTLFHTQRKLPSTQNYGAPAVKEMGLAKIIITSLYFD